MRIADHGEQRAVLRLTIDSPVGIEDFVTAMFTVGLREHHQFDIGGIAARAAEGSIEVVDLVIREREAELDIRFQQRLTSTGFYIDIGQRLCG